MEPTKYDLLWLRGCAKGFYYSCEEDALKAACDHNLNWPTRTMNTFEFDTFKPNYYELLHCVKLTLVHLNLIVIF